MEKELARRFDYACCSDMDRFQKEPMAVTPSGQLKSGGIRHEKDDRRIWHLPKKWKAKPGNFCSTHWKPCDTRPIWYWGDMDTHGFAMLDQIRHYFPQTRSFLMDEATLLSNRVLWGKEPSPTHRDLRLLTHEEAGVYDGLRHNRYSPQLRLEQERIPFSRVRQVVKDIETPPLPVDQRGG